MLLTRCSLATELPTLPIQLERSCQFCLVLVYWLLSAYSVGTAHELPILASSLAGIELGTSSSRGKCTNYLANHALYGLLG